MSAIAFLRASVAEVTTPAFRPRLQFGIWSGYALAVGFGALAIGAGALNLIAAPAELREDNAPFPRLLGVQLQWSGEIDVGDVQTVDREQSEFAQLSRLLAYVWLGERGSLGLICANARPASVFGGAKEVHKNIIAKAVLGL